MHVKIKNWRCIKEIEFDLGRINLFLGQNATGKSSLAYALYLLSKAPRIGVEILKMLYSNVKNVIRTQNNKLYLPTEILLNNDSFYVKITEVDELGLQFECVCSKDSPWKEEYLLSSTRIAYIQIFRFIMMQKENINITEKEKYKNKIENIYLPNRAKIFILDLWNAIEKYQEIIIRDLQMSTACVTQLIEIEYIPLMRYFNLKIPDKFIKDLKLPPEDASDGQTDYMLIDFILKTSSDNSLIVIEEPEIYKNPIFQFEMMEKISETALNKNLTVVMTTHSEIIPLSIAKLVEVGKIKPEDVKIYYLTRSKDDPWTKIKEIKIYEDGTLEELPDSEKITAHLF